MKIFLQTSLALMAIEASICNADIHQKENFRVFYTVFPSTIISPEVAKAHEITRAENKIIVNVSVKSDEQPTEAELTGQVTNLLEQVVELDFVEVKEREAIYYLATHISLPEDILRFNLWVKPINNEPFTISFMRRYD